jgi:PAS domain S-box-containing protein
MSDGMRIDLDLRERGARDAYLLALGDALRPLADPNEIQATACRVLGEYLGVNRVGYCFIRGDEYVLERDFFEDVPSLAGSRYPVAAFDPTLLARYFNGRTAVVSDIASDKSFSIDEQQVFVVLQVGAYIGVPLIKDDKLVGCLAVHSRAPREWSAAEVALVEETAERTWAIVERASAEEALARSEKHYRALFDSIDQGLCTIEVLFDQNDRPYDYRFVETNAAFERHTGITNAVGRRMREIAPHHEAYWFERYGQVALTGEATRFEHAAHALNRFYDVFAFRVGEPGERRVAILFNDITERKRRETHLAFLNEVSANLGSLEAVDDTMSAISAKIGTYLNVSRCCLVEVDERRDEASFKYVWHREDVSEISGTFPIADYCTREFRQAMVAGQSFVAHDVGIDSRLNAEKLTAIAVRSLACTPVIVDGQWRFVFMVLDSVTRQWRDDEIELMRDLTARIWARLERARYEQSLRNVEQQLRDADRRKDEFLATLAHELRNPLAPIRSSLQVLRRAGTSREIIDRMHGTMERQLTHLVRLVDDLLEVSRITRGKFELRIAKIDLANVIRNAIETSTPLIEAGAHQLTISMPDEPLLLEADGVRLAQVFANLLNNAAKYTESGGRIWLTARREETSAVISVRDSGTGIAADMLSKVFDLFTQADRTYERAQGGLGIGLTLVRSMVHMHGGSVEATSDGPGRGSEFIVRLPLAM